MEEYIKRTVKRLKMAMLGDYIALAIIVLMFETGCLDVLMGVGMEVETYLNYAAIIGTIILLPLGMKLFTLNTTENLRRQNFDEALKNYSVWFVVRSLTFFIVALFDMVCYYATMTSNGVWLTLIAVVLSLMFWPSEAKVKAYLENINK